MMWLGLATRVWAIVALGAAFRTTVEVDPGQTVVSSGPYKWIRHPSYTGLLLVVAGFGLAVGNWLALAVGLLLPLPGILWRIHVEEAELERVLGAAYSAYRARTTRLSRGSGDVGVLTRSVDPGRSVGEGGFAGRHLAHHCEGGGHELQASFDDGVAGRWCRTDGAALGGSRAPRYARDGARHVRRGRVHRHLRLGQHDRTRRRDLRDRRPGSAGSCASTAQRRGQHVRRGAPAAQHAAGHRRPHRRRVRRHTAYVLVANVGPMFGEPDVVAGDLPHQPGRHRHAGRRHRRLGDGPPADTDFVLPGGVQYAMEPFRGGFAVTDGHHNRVSASGATVR